MTSRPRRGPGKGGTPSAAAAAPDRDEPQLSLSGPLRDTTRLQSHASRVDTAHVKGQPETSRSSRRDLVIIVVFSVYLLCLGGVDLLIGKVGPGSAALFGGGVFLSIAYLHCRDGRQRGLLGVPDEGGDDTK